MLLIRKPVDAALSWSLFWEGRLKIEHSLNYYIDFHQALLPYREQLFVVSFDEAIGNFESVLKRFNRKFGTELEALPQNDSSLDRCFAFMEDWFREPDGRLNEFTVPRPSARRDDLKGKLAEELRTSSRLRKKLERAEQLYQSFCKPEHQLAGNDARPVAALRR